MARATWERVTAIERTSADLEVNAGVSVAPLLKPTGCTIVQSSPLARTSASCSMSRDPFVPVDPLADVLRHVRVSGTFYCRSELTAPWGLFMPPMAGCLWFHAVSEGRCLIEVDDLTIEAGPGSFVLVPHGRGHRLRSARRVAAPNVLDVPHEMVSERYAVLEHGGGGAHTSLVCGVVRLGPPAGPELERMLPPAVHLDAASVPHAGWMDSILAIMAAENRALRPGAETIVTRLSDVLVIQALRTWLDQDPDARRGWLGALRDPALGQALSAVWRAPDEPWTVERMATRAAMSRSTFSARFTELVGEPPMQHVTRVRMQVASAALSERGASVGELAAKLGYRSQAAFSRAFKRIVGKPAADVKRAARSPD